MQPLDFGTLVSYHKQEGSEELTYFTIMLTVMLGLLSYLGSAQKIEKQARLVICIVFAVFQTAFTGAIIGSMKIHDALHEEIRQFAVLHPDVFVHGAKSPLRQALIDNLGPHNPWAISISSLLLSGLLILATLTIGEGRLFTLWPKGLKKK